MFEPSGNYQNLLGITPADNRRPKLQGRRAETYILDEAPIEYYNVDWDNSFCKKTVHIKTPMQSEVFDMTFSVDFIRSNIQVYIMSDPLAKDFEITASFNPPFGPELKATGRVSHFVATAVKDAIQNMKNKLTDVLVCKVKTYYEGKVVKENMMNMNMYAMPDEICEILGLPAKTTEKKSKWIEGLPAVKKVETYNDRVVKVTFIDDTFTKSVCSENDHFDIDVGITICLLKRFMGTSSDNATREYNKTMNYIHAVMEKNEKERLARTEEEKTLKAKKRKIELKKAAKKLKAKEEQIDIYKQAILRAQKETFSQFEDGGSI